MCVSFLATGATIAPRLVSLKRAVLVYVFSAVYKRQSETYQTWFES